MDMYQGFNMPYMDATAGALMAENTRLETKIEEARRNLIKKQIDEIPQMSNRQLLEAIYRLLLQQG